MAEVQIMHNESGREAQLMYEILVLKGYKPELFGSSIKKVLEDSKGNPAAILYIKGSPVARGILELCKWIEKNPVSKK